MEKIKCVIREREVNLTPEEVVRQSFIEGILERGIDKKKLHLEKSIKVGTNTKLRMDIVIFGDDNRTHTIIETKAPGANMDLNQLFSYAKLELATYGIITDGKKTQAYRFNYENDFSKNKVSIDSVFEKSKDDETELDSADNSTLTNKLRKIHSDLWNTDGSDALEAFDQFSQILFIKFYYEKNKAKELKEYGGIFTRKFVEDIISKMDYKTVVNKFFDETKEEYKDDMIFEENATITISENSFLSSVEEIENIDFDGDVKGAVYENFLGGTFRKELGQYFTPRYIVKFINSIIKPKYDSLIIDPACGSGGFLIEHFKEAKDAIENLKISNERKDELIKKLSHDNIYGIDKDKRLARTARINMIMHGDGHSNIYRGNGLYNIGGIWENKFDYLISNPPYGANVKKEDEIQDLEISNEYNSLLLKKFGEKYKEENKKMKSMVGELIIDQYQILDKKIKSAKSELLFLIRSINLLKPGGKLGIVISDNVLNTKTMLQHRKEIMKMAKLDLVVKLPVETFSDANASVKTSLLFMTKKINENDENDKVMMFDASCPEMNVRERNTILDESANLLKEASIIYNEYDVQKKENEKFGFIDTSLISEKNNFRWDVQYYLYDKMLGRGEGELTSLSEILIPTQKQVKVSKVRVIKNNWCLLNKVSNDGKVYIHDFDKIYSIKSKDFHLVTKDRFVYSKMGAQNGCFFWNERKENFVVTSENPTFMISKDWEDKIRGKYIELILRTPRILKIIGSETTGSGRERIDEESFLKLNIPIPTISVQDEIIKMKDEIEKSKKIYYEMEKKLSSRLKNIIKK